MKWLLTLTEVGMLAYWLLAALMSFGFISIPPDYMYSDHQNPLVVAWNWSFFPLDFLFAVTGLVARFGNIASDRADLLSVVSLSLMFCAGLMAISFWTFQGAFDAFWWGINLWLIGLAVAAFYLQFWCGKRALS